MKGHGKLTVYAGQTVTMRGAGRLASANCDAFLAGRGSLAVKASKPGKVTMAGAGMLLAEATAPTRGFVWLPALRSIGGDKQYSISRQNLPPLTSSGSGDMYVPPMPVIGYGNLPAIVSHGRVTTISIARGDTTLPALQSRGGDFQYGVGVGTLPALRSFGYYGERLDAYLFDVAEAASVMAPVQEMIAVFTSSGALASIFTGDKEYIAEMLSLLSGSSFFTPSAEFSVEMIAQLVGNSLFMPQVGNSAVIDGRVWVVNMDTAASSQYDNYGFNSFFSRGGISYGVAGDGIYKLKGATDAGSIISGLLEIGRSDCGTRKPKKILDVYLGVSSSKDLYLKVNTDGQERVFRVERSGPAMKTHRVQIPYTVIGSHWNFTLMGDFDLSSVEFKPMPLARRT